MSRVLQTSGFLGFAVTMVVGLHQNVLLATGQGVPGAEERPSTARPTDG